MITFKSKDDFNKMSKAGKAVRNIHEEVYDKAKEGVSLKELDLVAKKVIEASGCQSNFLGYRGYPAYTCISPNDVIVHGIPSDYKLTDGDVLSVDAGAIFEGLHADAAFTCGIGKISDEARELIDKTKYALEEAIKLVDIGQSLGTIGHKIQSIGEKYSYGVVKEYIGHGIGFEMHEDPQVPNYGEKGIGLKLKEGMAICIEPMFNLGSAETFLEEDNWTVKTKDGSLSAHFEHTIGITSNGIEVFTK